MLCILHFVTLLTLSVCHLCMFLVFGRIYRAVCVRQCEIDILLSMGGL